MYVCSWRTCPPCGLEDHVEVRGLAGVRDVDDPVALDLLEAVEDRRQVRRVVAAQAPSRGGEMTGMTTATQTEQYRLHQYSSARHAEAVLSADEKLGLHSLSRTLVGV